MPVEWLAAALLAQAGTPVFAPPPGVPLTLEIDHRQVEAGRPERHYRSARRIVFERDGAGWRGTLTHGGASVDAPGDAFARALSATLAQPIVFRIDKAGAVVGVDEIEAVWGRLVAAMHAAAGDRASAPLVALPPAARPGMLASLIGDAIEARAAGDGAFAEEPIDLPAAPVAGGGAPAMLPGKRSAAIEGDRLVVRLAAAGPLALPAGATSSIERTTRIDPATGLLDERRERVESRMSDGTLGQFREMHYRLRYQDTRQQTRRQP
ncbi:hypothetical protein COC42_16440 [Sphingomonas spermidinifaciens]|uniref:Uncharacterized protein n=1 Tax=Sphingomonas spermidinifaciens TaxID=1141889 RepID=A0A2A4B174_9SPHN|nr:hypothetical protein [Sphingomonas spermidinifaciens]PCD01702.1 hypothetical protein COC42_16440 [Sphingomonas spermidinifaciens]